MKFLIDSFSPEQIQQIVDYYPVEGVTTNPTIICRESTELMPTLKKIRQIIGDKMLHVQTMQTTAEMMVKEALILKNELSAKPDGSDFFVKLPTGKEGIKACMELKAQNVGVTMTAIFSPAQALIAARAGADFVAPYVNKLDDTADGEDCVNQIAQIFTAHRLDTKTLAASFRNVKQITQMALYGSHYITLPPAFYEKLTTNPLTEQAIQGFRTDWINTYGNKLPMDFI